MEVIDIINNVIIELANDLSKNEMFLSEADLQFSFAQKLNKILLENGEKKTKNYTRISICSKRTI